MAGNIDDSGAGQHQGGLGTGGIKGVGIGIEDREVLLKVLAQVICIRVKYVRLAMLFERLEEAQIVSAAEQVQTGIDSVLEEMSKCLFNKKGDFEQLKKMLEDVMSQANKLQAMVLTVSGGEAVPKGLHPDDWAWMRGRSNNRSM